MQEPIHKQTISSGRLKNGQSTVKIRAFYVKEMTARVVPGNASRGSAPLAKYLKAAAISKPAKNKPRRVTL